MTDESASDARNGSGDAAPDPLGRADPGKTIRAAGISPVSPASVSPLSAEVRAFARPGPKVPETVAFDRHELRDILNLYGRKVAEGEWRDYAIDFSRETATFSVYRRASEFPLYRIEKTPKLARKQGAFSVVTTTGLILKRGHDLKRVLDVLDKKLKLVTP